MRGWLIAFAMLLSCAAAAADVLGTITILEGEALIYRGSGRVHAAEGLRVGAGDIVHTAPGTFAQVEMIDRTVIQLGPATRLMFQSTPTRQKTERSLYLLEGWLKLTSTHRDAAAGLGFDLRAPAFELPAGATVAVLRATPTEALLFVETGEARLAERPATGAPVLVALRPGGFYQRKPPARGSVAASVPAAFVESVPRPFRDSLPSRIDRFREGAVVPKEAGAFTYADVEMWLKAEPAVRRPLMQRLRAKAGEPAFRAALVANLSSHPEWDPILFPEKYKPKEPPRPAGDPQARAASAP